MEHVRPSTDRKRVARKERVRMLHAIQGLEHALASASFDRVSLWGERITESLVVLQTALRETRETADAKGGLFDELVQESPRLQGRTELLRKNYDALQEHVESMRSALREKPPLTLDDVGTVREQLANLLAKVRQIQAAETELLFEAYDVDIGVGD